MFLYPAVPTLKITTEPSGIHLDAHRRENLTFQVSDFYPPHLHLTWMENRPKIQTVEAPQVTRNPDRTCSVEHRAEAGRGQTGGE